jgi:hypothetical protein
MIIALRENPAAEDIALCPSITGSIELPGRCPAMT